MPEQGKATVSYDWRERREYYQPTIPKDEPGYMEPTGDLNMPPMRIQVREGDEVLITMTGSMRGRVYGSLWLTDDSPNTQCLGRGNLLSGMIQYVPIPDGDDYLIQPGWRPFAIQRIDKALADGILEYKLGLCGKDLFVEGATGTSGAYVLFAQGRVATLEIINYKETP